MTASFQGVDDLIWGGLHLQALEMLRRLAPGGDVEKIEDPRGRLLAARLHQHCGAPERSYHLLRRAYHRDRSHIETAYFYGRRLLERHGPLACLRFHEARPEPGESPDDMRAEWLAQRAIVWMVLRDFDAAWRLLDEALRVAPQNAWIHVEKSAVLEAQDRYAEALEASREAIRLRPWYRPAVQAAAHQLQLLGDDQGALALLREGAGRQEAMYLWMQLSSMEQELGHYAAARESLAQARRLVPLLEEKFRKLFDMRAFDLTYLCGDLKAAAELGAGQDEEFVTKAAGRIREHLAGGPHAAPADLDQYPPHRVRLNVGFVRQHHMTCVPATLATLCRYWGMPQDHLAIAQAICYDGTPPHRERAWAREAGFMVREFALTWEAGVALIDRGVPFVLTTVAPEQGHAQAVIGYDAFRQTFLIRDPYVRSVSEFIADKALEHFKSSGPRCLVIVPEAEAGHLQGLALPEAGLYDRLDALQQALERHDRAAAQQACDALTVEAPGHRIAHYGVRCLASYDANRSGTLAATEELLKLYPRDENLRLSKLHCLRDLARRQDRVTLLRDICREKGCAAVFWQKLAEELLGDARESGVAVRLLERRIRRTPQSAGAFAALAQHLWNQRQFERAFTCYRIAACLDDKCEQYARDYFAAARHVRKTDEALDFLRLRFAALADKSSAPGRTLFGALAQINRHTEAFAVLEEALARRPEDADLLTFAANTCVRYQKIERGLELLRKAEPISHRLNWLYSAAQVADLRCRLEEALALWRELAERDPLCQDAQQAIARLLAETKGRSEALAYLRGLAERFPHHMGIHNLLIYWERTEPLEQREKTIRRLMAIDPDDAWCHRELALLLAEAGRDAEALSEVKQAELLEPEDERTANVMMEVHERGGRAPEARQWARRALTMSVDNQIALHALMRLCPSTEERRTELNFVQEELKRQVIFGESLLTFRRVASTVLEPAEVTARLRDAHRARPDLWHAWSALILQLLAQRELDEAEKVAREAVERFPLLPRLWADLSQVYAERGDREARVAAMEEALALAPAWGLASRMLASVHETRGEMERARQCLEEAVARDPLDHHNHGYLAQVLWKLGDRTAAIARMEHALQLNAEDQFYWDSLRAWGVREGKANLALDKARELTRLRAGDAEGWRRLARILPEKDAEALSAVEKAIALEPRNAENYDLKAQLLGDAGRFDEAEAACRPQALGDPPPMLRARAAWLLARRGRRDQAIAAMREVLKVDQSNYWAWRELSEWISDAGDKAEYLAVCRRIAALWPRDAGALELLAHARMENAEKEAAERAAAKADLRRALEIDPDRAYAADRLFGLHLEDGELPQAEQVLRHIRQQARPSSASLQETKLALAQPDFQAVVQTATRAARTLCLTPTAQRYQVRALHDAAVGHVHGRAHIERTITAAALETTCNEHVPALAVEIHVAAGHWREAAAVVSSHRPGTPAWSQACYALIRAAGKARRQETVKSLLREHPAEICNDIHLWGIVSYAFAAADRHRDTVNWMHDHAQRQDVEAWMLMNLGNSLSSLGRAAQAAEVHARALNLPPDSSRGGHLIWLAIYRPAQFAAGAVAQGEAPSSLDEIVFDKLQNEEKDLLFAARVRIALAAQATGRAVHSPEFAEAWKEMGRRIPTARKDKLAKRFYRRTCARLLWTSRNPRICAQALWRLVRLSYSDSV